MAYADYDFYVNNYIGSSISAEDFNYLAERASDFMDSVTFGRLKNSEYPQYRNEIKKCCCAVAEAINGSGNSNDRISSEKIGDYSVSYRSGTARRSLENIAAAYLGNTGLLYRGDSE